MPDVARAVSGIPRADPGGRVTPRFWHRLNRFRHFCGGSLALASLDRACRTLVPTFPQRSLPRLLTAAACGGLRSAPDCRTRRALLHLSYSCAPLVLMTALVTHDPDRTWALGFCCGARADLLYLARDPGLGVSPHEAPRLHHPVWRCSRRMAARGAREYSEARRALKPAQTSAPAARRPWA